MYAPKMVLPKYGFSKRTQDTIHQISSQLKIWKRFWQKSVITCFLACLVDIHYALWEETMINVHPTTFLCEERPQLHTQVHNNNYGGLDMKGFSHLGVKNLCTKTTRRVLVFTSIKTDHITWENKMNHIKLEHIKRLVLTWTLCMVLRPSLVDPE